MKSRDGERLIELFQSAANSFQIIRPAHRIALANFTPPDDEVVRIGYLPITDATALLVAHGMGFFEQEGLKSAAPTLIRGWSPLVEGFTAGKFNLVHLLKPIPVWMRYNNHFPVKIMSWAHINGSGVVVGRHVDAKDFSDLSGRQVAVPYWYSMHNVVLQLALRNAGLKPVIKDQEAPLGPDEVNLLIMPPPDMPPALAARKIDAFIVAEPFNALGELKAGGKMLRFTGDIWKNHPCCVVCMNEKTVKAKPEWTQTVMNAIVRAMTHYKDKAYANPRAVRHPEFGNGRIDFSPYPYPSATKLIVEAMNNTLVGGDTTFLKGLDPRFVAEDLVDYTHVKAAMAKYHGWEKAPGVDPAHPFERTEVVSL